MACKKPLQVRPPHHDEYVSVPCGWCTSCRIDKRTSWSYRINSDVQRFEFAGRNSSFVTFTYDDYHLPRSGSLVKDHLKSFHHSVHRSIRRHIPGHSDYKYYSVGEYGGTFGRPHYHVLYIGLPLSDLYVCAHAWPYGFVMCLPLLSGGIDYVLKYIDKQVHGDAEKAIYGDMQPPFALSSKGIGKQDFVDNLDQYRERLSYNRGERVVPLPYYYRRKLERLSGHTLSLKDDRYRLQNIRLAHNAGRNPQEFVLSQAIAQERSRIHKSYESLDRESPLEPYTLRELEQRYTELSIRLGSNLHPDILEDLYV